MVSSRSKQSQTYLITFTCYGTRLHGDEKGAVDRHHNLPGSRSLPLDEPQLALEGCLMREGRYNLDERRRAVVLASLREVCAYRGRELLAAHVRTSHAHAVVSAAASPEQVMNDFKAYASRSLNRAEPNELHRRRWTRHGSTQYLWKRGDVASAIEYVVREQGWVLAVYEKQ